VLSFNCNGSSHSFALYFFTQASCKVHAIFTHRTIKLCYTKKGTQSHGSMLADGR